MNIPKKQLQNGFSLPVYGLGLWQMGGGMTTDYSNDDTDQAAIDHAINAGVTHIDTAELYGAGHAEELLGQVLQHHDRSKLQIATKVLGEHQGYADLLRSFEASLKRMNTEYVDLYMLHSYPDPGTPIADTMRAMDYLVGQGVVKHIGVSNLTPKRFAEAKKHTKHALVCNQVHYNMRVREIEKAGVLKDCQENDVFLVAWRPLKGVLDPVAPIVAELATKYSKTPSQIALNWLVSQDHVVVISKTSNAVHLEENLGALDFALSTDDIERLRVDYPDQQMMSEVYPLNYPGDVAPY